MTDISDEEAELKKAKALAQVRLGRKARDTGQLTKMAPTAKEINSRLERAERADDKSVEHRVSAALLLVQAQEECKVHKISFKDWCEANIEYSYERARKLLMVGKADEPRKALEDMRLGNIKRAKKSVAKRTRTPAPKPPSEDPPPVATPLAMLKGSFKEMVPSDKMKFLNWAAESVGAEVQLGFDPAPEKRVGTELVFTGTAEEVDKKMRDITLENGALLHTIEHPEGEIVAKAASDVPTAAELNEIPALLRRT